MSRLLIQKLLFSVVLTLATTFAGTATVSASGYSRQVPYRTVVICKKGRRPVLTRVIKYGRCGYPYTANVHISKTVKKRVRIY